MLPHPQASRAGTGFCIQPGKFHGVFAASLPAGEAAILAASQQPAADIAFGEPLAVEPGWKKVPSWFIVARSDHAINRTPSAPPPSGWARPRSRSMAARTPSHCLSPTAPVRRRSSLSGWLPGWLLRRVAGLASWEDRFHERTRPGRVGADVRTSLFEPVQ